MTRILLILSVATFALASCTQQDVSKLTETQKTDRLEGEWRITLFEEDNGAETHDFSDYTFNFSTDGTFTALVNGQSHNGTWTFGQDDGLERIYVSISGTNKLLELTDDWVLADLTKKSMTWTDDNASSGERVEWEK